MSVDLTSRGGSELSLRGSGWDFILNLAEAYGWQAPGTRPPPDVDPGEWDGSYDSSDGQTVTTEDALALAQALRRARADPQRADVERRVSRELDEAVRRIMLRDHGVELPPDHGGERHLEAELLDELCAFCEQGAFTVT